MATIFRPQGPAQAPMPVPIQQAYANDPRQAMAAELIARGTAQTPVWNNTQGFARLATALLGGYQKGQVRREYQGQADAYRKAQAEALAALQSGDRAGAAQAAQGNPYLAESLGLPLALSGMEHEQKKEIAGIQAGGDLLRAMFGPAYSAYLTGEPGSREALIGLMQGGVPGMQAQEQPALQVPEGGTPPIAPVQPQLAAMGGAQPQAVSAIDRLLPKIEPKVKVPEGYRRTPTGDLERIPGGPEDPEVISAQEQAKQDAKKPFSAKQVQTAKDKLLSIDAIKHQLGVIRQKFEPLKGTVDAGPITGHLPTEKGKAFDEAVNALRPFIRQLTRTPGEGAMSDYESKLAELVNPRRTTYESVTQQQMDQIDDLLNVIQTGYADMAATGDQPAGVAGEAQQTPSPQAEGEWKTSSGGLKYRVKAPASKPSSAPSGGVVDYSTLPPL